MRFLKALALGEVLWDDFGSVRHLGGAPLNFAYHFQSLGGEALLISAVGQDPDGDQILARCNALHMSTAFLQRDPDHATGIAEIRMKPDGHHDFHIRENAAWDYVHLTPELELHCDDCDIVCFNTLGQRSPEARNTIRSVVQRAPDAAIRVFDLNLRPPHYDAMCLYDGLTLANIVKANAGEFVQLKNLLVLPSDPHTAARILIDRFELRAVVVSDGEHGAWAVDPEGTAHAPAPNVTTCDTVGCGDAFLAAFMIQWMRGSSLLAALELGVLAGSYVAAQPGATPSISREQLDHFASSRT